ncbi:MAG: hypothetical protein A2Z45_04710 [Chloroflexi bacterium RBG_19FT_COMBO_55_16]|nr:MAG: hypothetical protein A2Z45_04710 [Chloroflexi bacterium RBG_19FT_COMBO_55_16]
MVMQSKEKRSPRSQSDQKKRNLPWAWIALGAVVAVALAVVFWLIQNRHTFVIAEGETEVVVLLRNEKEATYRIKHEGRKPVDMQTLQVMLAGQILHVDVKQVTLVHDGQEVVLEPDGRLPAGTEMKLAPGDLFDVRVTMIGQTTGGNYLYGFRLGYAAGNRTRTDELVLEYEYKIFVE